MFVDFGYIDKYNASTGIGRIEKSLRPGKGIRKFAIFYIEHVHQPDLRSQLALGTFYGRIIWYRCKSTEELDQVIDVWLSIEEMNQETIDGFSTAIIKFSLALTDSKPTWLDRVTSTFFGIDNPHPGRDVSKNNESWRREVEQILLEAQSREAIRRDEVLPERQRIREEEEKRRKEAEEREAARKAEMARIAQIEALDRQKKRKEEQKRRQEAEKREVDRRAAEGRRSRLEALERQRRREEEQKRRQEEEERERQVLAEERSKAIRDFCKKREIKTLMHFTRIENLASILKYGLLSRSKLETKAFESSPITNDEKRLDEQEDAVCVSISFPNNLMFYKYRQGSNEKWVVIALKASLLWEMDCAFNAANAASKSMTVIPIEIRKEFSHLDSMFCEDYSDSRQQMKIPDHYPTDPQAEVLVFEDIPPDWIESVFFHNQRIMAEWQCQNTSLWRDSFNVNSFYFSQRPDYRNSGRHATVREPDSVYRVPPPPDEFPDGLSWEPFFDLNSADY